MGFCQHWHLLWSFQKLQNCSHTAGHGSTPAKAWFKLMTSEGKNKMRFRKKGEGGEGGKEGGDLERK